MGIGTLSYGKLSRYLMGKEFCLPIWDIVNCNKVNDTVMLDYTEKSQEGTGITPYLLQFIDSCTSKNITFCRPPKSMHN